MLDAIVSTIATGGAGMAGTAYQNYLNKKEANRSRDWQAQMSNTSHRREVEDLRAAGLNPILSANAGASTPQGATPQMENMTEGLASTAMDAIRLKSELKQIESGIGLNIAQAKAAEASSLKDATTAKNTGLQNEALQLALPALEAHSKYDKEYAPVDAFLKRFGQGSSAIHNLMPKINIGKPKSSPKINLD